MNDMQNAAVGARVAELQAQFDEWALRRELQDRIILASILKAWGFPMKGATWQH